MNSLLVEFIQKNIVLIQLFSITMLLGSLVVTLIAVLTLPYDYWVKTRQRKASWPESIVRNLIALVMFIFGLIMLLLPGQGILTIVISIVVADMPFKKKCIRYFIKKPKVRGSLNYIRKKFSKKEFIWP